jgi:predicted short-subunit dehydrogenase-like oxidoreductase (DUF2520 family)
MAARPPSSRLRVAVAGAGRVAVAVATLLRTRGHDVGRVWSRDPASADRAAQRLGATTAPSAADAAEGADVVLIGAVDSAIGAVAADLGSNLDAGTTVVHFAGALGIGALDPAPCARAALHPVQSVPDVDVGVERLPGSAWGVTVSPGRESWAHAFVRDELRGVPVDVDEADRPLWHAAAVMTSNGIAALMSTGAALLAGVGVSDPQAVLGPLAEGTVANVRALGRGGIAFTGPVVRGDRATVERHLEELRARFPQLRDEYTLIARAIVAGAARTARIDDDTARSMRAVLATA